MPAVQPRQKALASIEAVLAAIHVPEDEPAISARLRARLGLGWSITTALQYLTGKAAQEAVRSASSTMSADARGAMEMAMWMANHYCATASPSGPISSGLLVQQFRESGGTTEQSVVRGLEAVRASLSL
jgi:hypothetical protein